MSIERGPLSRSERIRVYARQNTRPTQRTATHDDHFEIIETVLPCHHLNSNFDFRLGTAHNIRLPHTIPFEDILFLDVECMELGFSPVNVPWLIGLADFIPEGLRIRQLFARHPIAEVQSLRILDKFWETRKTIVTYNGKSFDIPLIRSRYQLFRETHRELNFHHIDLYHTMKRFTKQSRYRLIDTEAEFLDFARKDDLPGSMSGQAYFEYQQFGNQEGVQKIIEHNKSDLASMAATITNIHRLQSSIEEKKSERLFPQYRFFRIMALNPEVHLKNLQAYHFKTAADWHEMGSILAKQKKVRQAAYCYWRAYRLGRKSVLMILLRFLLRNEMRPLALKLHAYALQREEAKWQEKLLQIKV